jgi:S1-C subfamily serine protease
MRRRYIFATAVVFAVAIALVSITIYTIPPNVIAAEPQTITSSLQNANSSSALAMSLSLKTIFKQVENSVVQITSKIPITAANPLNPPSQNRTALGSGFVYDKQGHIVTNSHVVGGATIVDVTFVDGNRYTAKVIARDIYSDMAVIQISQNITSQQQRQLLPSLKPLVIGNSSKLEVGDQVIAIGNPFGLSDTMTTGIVSGLGRSLPAAAAVGFSISNTIQTDAPINPGNSGGPLLDMQGQLIGMNTAILSGTDTFSGIGFAIPSNTITKIVPTLIGKGYYVHPYLGLNINTLTTDLAANITGIPLNLKGVYVDTIKQYGPADKAGVHGSTTDQYSKKHLGDIIIAVDRHNVTKSDDLITYIDQHKSVGENVTLTVFRNGHTTDLKVTLAARPSPFSFLITQSAPPPSPIPNPPRIPHTQPPLNPHP